MAHWVFVKVTGFTDVERHSLNAVFRISGQFDTVYSLWMADSPAQPRLALIDEQSEVAGADLQAALGQGQTVIWVGAQPPTGVWRAFERPIAWNRVIQAMDELFAAPDYDGGMPSDMQDTQPPDTEPEPPCKRALIVSADLGERLYMRAKLSLANLTVADDAETAAQALELAASNVYAVALLDFGMPDMDGWVLLRRMQALRPAVPHVIVTKGGASLLERIRGRIAGVDGFFTKPPHPARLHSLLLRV